MLAILPMGTWDIETGVFLEARLAYVANEVPGPFYHMSADTKGRGESRAKANPHSPNGPGLSSQSSTLDRSGLGPQYPGSF